MNIDSINRLTAPPALRPRRATSRCRGTFCSSNHLRSNSALRNRLIAQPATCHTSRQRWAFCPGGTNKILELAPVSLNRLISPPAFRPTRATSRPNWLFVHGEGTSAVFRSSSSTSHCQLNSRSIEWAHQVGDAVLSKFRRADFRRSVFPVL